MKVIRGKFSDYKHKVLPLLQEHWDEVGLAGGPDLTLNPDFKSYEFLEKSGTLECFGIEDDGELIGYLALNVYPHQHHAHVKFAITDLFYVKKSRRSPKTFRYVFWMFRLAERTLFLEHGVQYVQLVYSKNNDLSKFAKALGYVESDVVCVKKVNNQWQGRQGS